MKNRAVTIVSLLFCVTVVLVVIYGFTGNWPWEPNPYNSYSLQALSWLKGRLDLGQNYTHLELAIFEGKYFVSFPPFPSYVMIPFVLLFGASTPDGILAFLITLMGAVYGIKLYWLLGQEEKHSLFWTVFLIVGTNQLFVSVNGWVWFLAQNMCFLLTLMALYYMERGKGGLALFLWAASVGCRPFQAIYLPLFLWRIYQKQKEEYPQENTLSVIKKRYMWGIPVGILALSYMLLNYFRFGSIIEFGHNYLPEFLESPKGQFHLDYLRENIVRLFRLPQLDEVGKFQFYQFDGNAFWLVSPLFLSFLIYYIWYLFGKDRKKEIMAILLPLLIMVHVIIIMLHKTMGGWHFGNRYINDTLPYVFYGLLYYLPKEDDTVPLHYGFFLMGLLLNVVGTILIY